MAACVALESFKYSATNRCCLGVRAIEHPRDLSRGEGASGAGAVASGREMGGDGAQGQPAAASGARGGDGLLLAGDGLQELADALVAVGRGPAGVLALRRLVLHGGG